METGIQIRIRKFEKNKHLLYVLCGVGILVAIVGANIAESKNAADIFKGVGIVSGVIWALGIWVVLSELDETHALEKRVRRICNSDEFVMYLLAYADQCESFQPKNVDDVKIFFFTNYMTVFEHHYQLEKSYIGNCNEARGLATRKYCEKNTHIKEFCSPDNKVHIYAD